MKRLNVNFNNSRCAQALCGFSYLAAVSLLACLGLPATSKAQTQPNASTLQQQIERDQQAEKQRLQIKPPPQAQVETPLVGQTVVIKEFKFKGNTLLSSEELNAALATLKGRPLDFARLQSSPVLVADL